MKLENYIRAIPDFPRAGVIYRDITPLLADPIALRLTFDLLRNRCEEANLVPDYVVGVESRGFMFGAHLAYEFNAGFIPVRKAGKLPSAVYEAQYVTEYSKDRLEVHRDAIPAGQKARVLIVDDLLASGGTANATVELLKKFDCEIVGLICLVELISLHGRRQLPSQMPVISLVQY